MLFIFRERSRFFNQNTLPLLEENWIAIVARKVVGCAISFDASEYSKNFQSFGGKGKKTSCKKYVHPYKLGCSD